MSHLHFFKFLVDESATHNKGVIICFMLAEIEIIILCET